MKNSGTTKKVFLNMQANTVSFIPTPHSICIGEADETLQVFIKWLEQDWITKGISYETTDIPTAESV